MRKLSAFLLAAALLLSMTPAASAEEPPALSAKSAIVMNSGGEVVFAYNADERRLIASTTKLMTAILAIENNDVDEVVEIEPAWCGIEGSSMYLRAGERYSVRELLIGLLLASGNDAAVALACHTAGDLESFVALMNEKARALGMTASSFFNPHGLDAPEHASTAHDMAVLMCYCMENPVFAELTSLQSAAAGEQMIYNHNKLLSRYSGCIGGKTGYTEAAGRCLVSCAERDGTRFICVTLSDPDDWKDHAALYDWAFAHYANRTVVDGSLSFEIPVLSGKSESVTVVPGEDCTLFLPREEELVLIAEMPRFIFAPIQEGQTAGRILVQRSGETVAELPLIYAVSVERSAVLAPSQEIKS